MVCTFNFDLDWVEIIVGVRMVAEMNLQLLKNIKSLEHLGMQNIIVNIKKSYECMVTLYAYWRRLTVVLIRHYFFSPHLQSSVANAGAYSVQIFPLESARRAEMQ